MFRVQAHEGTRCSASSSYALSLSQFCAKKVCQPNLSLLC